MVFKKFGLKIIKACYFGSLENLLKKLQLPSSPDFFCDKTDHLASCKRALNTKYIFFN